MRQKRLLLKIIVMVLAGCLFLAACSAGGETSPAAAESSAKADPQTIPEKTEEDKTEPEEKETTGEETAPVLTETAPELTETEPVQDPEEEDWRAKYAALPEGLQQALIPADVASEDDFLAMSAKTLEGTEWSGAELANYDMTVIDCWMTWCGPCREEMPTLQKVFMELPETINMMGICFDGKDETSLCKTIVTQSGVGYNVLLGDDVSGDPFNLANYTQGVPTLLFVDPQGHCFARFVGRPLTDAIEEKDALNIIINLALEKLKGE